MEVEKHQKNDRQYQERKSKQKKRKKTDNISRQTKYTEEGGPDDTYGIGENIVSKDQVSKDRFAAKEYIYLNSS